MKWISYFLFIGLYILVPLKLVAYEIDTHASITQKTIPRTVLTDPQFLQTLGLDKYNNDYGLTYFDYYDSIIGELQERTNNKTEGKIIKDLKEVENSLKGWFMRGAIREDDCWVPFLCTLAWDDPVNDNRPLNHFFDPYSNTALSSFVESAPNWTLGTKEAFKSPLTPIADDDINYTKYNHYTIFDAQEAMARALSGQYTDNTRAVVKLDTIQRKAYWATTFRTLGNVVHLIQDMGQPQHTRNDAHSKVNTLEQQVYEKFINARALDSDYECIYGEIIEKDKLPPLKFKLTNGTDYHNPNFNKYSDFFSTLPGGAIQDGRGLADYSNREFFTAGTNKDDTKYPSPNIKILTETKEKFTSSCVTEYAADFTVYNGTVEDQNDISKNSIVSLTSRSIWDLDDPNIWGIDDPRNTLPKFSLTQKNYNQMADNLIPRAVAYSAGLINHFFRGRLDVTKKEQKTDTTGNAIVAITIKNTSTQNLSMTNGKFEIFYDAIVEGVEVRKPALFADGVNGEIAEIKNGDEVTLNIVNPTDVDPDKENPFVVVFKGDIGVDPGVAGKVFSIAYETALLAWKVSFIGNEYYTDIHRSLDYGKTWKNVTNRNFQIAKLGNRNLLGEIISLGSNQAMALIGHINDTGEQVIEAIATKDNGITWENSLESTKLVSTDQFPWQTPYNNWNQSKYIKTASGGYLFSLDMVKQITTDKKIIYAPHIVESFDLGKTWTVASKPITKIGVEFWYAYKVDMGNGLILVQGYNKDTLLHESYKSTNAGRSWDFNTLVQGMTYTAPDFSSGLFSHIAMQDAGQILAIDYTTALLEETFMVSNDLGASWTHTFLINDLAPTWPYMEVYNISYLGNGRVVANVFDGWSNWDNFFYGVITSADYGQTWEIASSGYDTWDNYTSMIEKLGVVTNDPALVGVIHSSSK